MARNLEREKFKGKEFGLKSRLSRKISELTMVVHLLFTRNHEREIEIETWKTVYENEISAIHKDLKGKIGWLEGQLNQLEKFKVLFDLKNVECDKLKEQIVQHQDNENRLKFEIDEKNHLLSVAETEILELKELMNGKQQTGDEQIRTLTGEIEHLKNENKTLSEKLSVKVQKIKKYQLNSKEQQEKIDELESELKETLTSKEELFMQLSGVKGEWQVEIDHLEKTVKDLSKSKEESEDLIDKLKWKNKQLTQKKDELTNQVKDLESQLQQLANEHSRLRKESRARCSPEVQKYTPSFDVGILVAVYTQIKRLYSFTVLVRVQEIHENHGVFFSFFVLKGEGLETPRKALEIFVQILENHRKQLNI